MLMFTRNDEQYVRLSSASQLLLGLSNLCPINFNKKALPNAHKE